MSESSFKICVRETKIFDGLHKNIKIVSIVGYRIYLFCSQFWRRGLLSAYFLFSSLNLKPLPFSRKSRTYENNDDDDDKNKNNNNNNSNNNNTNIQLHQQ